MKLILKTLGFVFSALISVLIAVIFFLTVCNWNMLSVVQLFNEKPYEAYMSAMPCIAMAVLIAFCPVWFAINEAIDNKFD